MRYFFNPNRFAELVKEEHVKRAAEAILLYANRDVLLVLVYGWCILLAAVFSLLFTIRLALSIPLWHG